MAEPHLVVRVLRCRTCDFYYVDSLLAEAKELEHFHYANAATYPGMEASDAGSIRERLALLEPYISRGKLLDVGAGKGEFVLGAARAGWDAMGVEPSGDLARHGRSIGANIRTGRLDEQSQLPLAGFKAITLVHVLEHVPDPTLFLKSLLPFLSPSGVVFVEVPNCDSMLLRVIDLSYRLSGRGWSARLSPFHPPFHRWGYTRKSLAYALRQSGYQVLRIGTLPGKGRGYGLAGNAQPVHKVARRLVSRILDLAGNRELLYAVCRSAAAGRVEESAGSR